MPREELLLLDGYEGHPVVYRRRRKKVSARGGARFAEVYALPEGAPPGVPSNAYLGVLARAYKMLGFDRRDLVAALHERRWS
jgi:hypothetical protein